jgi:DNA-binding response OmpR family regulator
VNQTSRFTTGFTDTGGASATYNGGYQNAMTGRILVLSERPEMLELFREILVDQDCELLLESLVSCDASRVAEIAPDLLVLDDVYGCHNPARGLLYSLKLQQPVTPTPIIAFTTSREEQAHLCDLLHAAQVEVLLKPFELDDFLQTTETLLARA